jgi:hypothetical protein
VAAEAAPVEVGDGREHSGGHFRVASSRRIYRASRQREVTTFGSVEVIGKRVKEIDGRAERERDNVVYWKTKRKIKNDLQ